ncbi:MAG: hypothetical protein CME88_05085 [Hirschia sp.]|nr:hypothetical protein [Hirschia sp.]MBF17737.1 hypothetical protein [Hirschia sp.]
MAAIGLVACTSIPPAEPYFASVETTQTLQSTLPADTRIAIGTFTASESVENTPKCRLAGRINPAGTQTIPDYIRSAFVTELKAADLYDAEAPIVLSGQVLQSDLVSTGTASWTINLTLSNGDDSFDTMKVSEFQSRFEAGAACAASEAAYRNAVSELVKTIIAKPEFAALVSDAGAEAAPEAPLATETPSETPES